jgi:hypothetical protein
MRLPMILGFLKPPRPHAHGSHGAQDAARHSSTELRGHVPRIAELGVELQADFW